MSDLLKGDAIERWLRDRSGWERQKDALSKEFRFPTFQAAIAFVNRVAELADQADHHPDIDVRFDRVRLRLSSHDVGGVSARDVALAEKVERVAG